jgi:hypothetical protein
MVDLLCVLCMQQAPPTTTADAKQGVRMVFLDKVLSSLGLYDEDEACLFAAQVTCNCPNLHEHTN